MNACLVATAVVLVLIAIVLEFSARGAGGTEAIRMANSTEIQIALLGRNFSSIEIGQEMSNPATLHFKLIGSEENPVKVLIIHGFGGRGDLWGRSIAPALVKKGCQVLVFDNRGVGLSSYQSTYPLGRYTTRLMALDALELLNAIGWQNAHVVGHR
jgi:pimeloyl-ACP methyl ester carboxylesterase